MKRGCVLGFLFIAVEVLGYWVPGFLVGRFGYWGIYAKSGTRTYTYVRVRMCRRMGVGRSS